MKRALPYILYSLVIAGAAALLIYQGFVTKDLESGNLVKGLLMIAAALLGMFRPRNRRQIVNKKATYQKAYGEYIQNAFSEDRKLEILFYKAVDDYNQNRPAAAISKLNKLRKECHHTAEIYAVTFFLALCHDDMQLYGEAIKHYDAAAKIRPTSTLYSNMGLCQQRMGQKDSAQESYEQAIRLDPSNAFAYNNLAAMYFREGAYHDALEYAEQAIQADPNLPQALGTAAVCSALLGETEDYERYYRQAVAHGYDGNKIKATIRSLDPEI